MDRKCSRGCRRTSLCARGRIRASGALRTALRRAAEYCERKCAAGDRSFAGPPPFPARRAASKARRNAGRSRPTTKRSAISGKAISYQNVQRSGKHVETLALQKKAFAINHHCDGRIDRKVDFTHCSAGSERMPHMRAIEKRVKIAEQSYASDWPPANIFNQTITRIGLRGDHHFAARKLAVAERKKQAAAPVEFRGAIGSQRKCAPVKPCQTRQHAQNVAELAPAFEAPICDVCHIRRESERQQIYVMQFAPSVFQPNHVARAALAVQDCLLRRASILRTTVSAKIAQKRIAGSQWQESEGAAVPAVADGGRENAVDDFIRSAITADGEKLSIAHLVSFARQFSRVTCGVRLGDIDLNSPRS